MSEMKRQDLHAYLESVLQDNVRDAQTRAKALEAAGLLKMQADRDTQRTREERTAPQTLRGPKASRALVNLQSAFRLSTGVNVFDSRSEELVRAAWNTARAIVQDERDRLSEGYRNSGADDSPDLDAVSALASLLEVPPNLGDLMWGRFG